MVRFRDKKNESDDTDGVFAAVPEDIIAHRILARLDAISMFRFALSSKTNFERVFGDNKDGTTNPNNSIITKTSSSSSSSTMMMVRRIKLLTWNVKRDDEQPILLPCVVGPSRDDDDDGRGLDCWWSSKTTRRRRTTMIWRNLGCSAITVKTGTTKSVSCSTAERTRVVQHHSRVRTVFSHSWTREIAKSLSNVPLRSNQRTSFRRQRCRRFWKSTFRRLSPPNAKSARSSSACP